MSDNADKTVFRQPMPGGDRTVMRPMPGGRRPGHAPEPQAGPQSASSVGREHFPPVQSSVDFTTDTGLNPLVNAASTLIAVYHSTRHSTRHQNVAGLHQSLVNEMRQFEQRAREREIKPEVVLAARYLLCSVLDEAVLNTPWGSESPWAQKTLLSVFHGETSGGEKFFQILDRMRQTPGENIDFLEFAYVLLSLGFEGKYRVVNRGRESIERIKDDLFATIRHYRGEYERTLSPNWQGLGSTRRSLTEHVPFWVAASIFAAILFFGFSGFRYWLYNMSTPVAVQLEEIANRETPRR